MGKLFSGEGIRRYDMHSRRIPLGDVQPPSGFPAAVWRTAACDRPRRLHCADERAHELALDLWCESFHIYAFAREKLPCILDGVDPRCLYGDRHEAGRAEFAP